MSDRPRPRMKPFKEMMADRKKTYGPKDFAKAGDRTVMFDLEEGNGKKTVDGAMVPYLDKKGKIIVGTENELDSLTNQMNAGYIPRQEVKVAKNPPTQRFTSPQTVFFSPFHGRSKDGMYPTPALNVLREQVNSDPTIADKIADALRLKTPTSNILSKLDAADKKRLAVRNPASPRYVDQAMLDSMYNRLNTMSNTKQGQNAVEAMDAVTDIVPVSVENDSNSYFRTAGGFTNDAGLHISAEQDLLNGDSGSNASGVFHEHVHPLTTFYRNAKGYNSQPPVKIGSVDREGYGIEVNPLDAPIANGLYKMKLDSFSNSYEAADIYQSIYNSRDISSGGKYILMSTIPIYCGLVGDLVDNRISSGNIDTNLIGTYTPFDMMLMHNGEYYSRPTPMRTIGVIVDELMSNIMQLDYNGDLDDPLVKKVFAPIIKPYREFIQEVSEMIPRELPKDQALGFNRMLFTDPEKLTPDRARIANKFYRESGYASKSASFKDLLEQKKREK